MAQGKSVNIRASDSPQGEKIIVAIRFTRFPQPSKPQITPIATDANGSIMAEAVPVKEGWIVRLRAQGSTLPRFRDSENVYPTLTWAEDSYWRDCEAKQFRRRWR